MLTKFETKSPRVKGLAFHPNRPFILASLHNGTIQLWDYKMGTLLERYEDHDGPVRGIDFHPSQNLFCSGGDDYKLKVWRLQRGGGGSRPLFNLLGHLDYIRTTKFHHEYPWIVSASDDQTIRIWNWQSRSSISVLTGHNHYVMCAEFHPKDDLVVSASLDQTVRVWDTSGLRKKTVRGAPSEHDMQSNNAVISRVNADLFGGTDAVVKYVLEGHDRGVNWASFHHTLPLIISGADDRQIKLWRMSETKAWEVDAMRGHTNNVSCVIFHPKAELLVSNSEDRSIRVWDISRRQGVQTIRREHDRFWILAAHPEQNLLAAGHDSGMIVFKLERERPAYDTQANNTELYYVKDRYLRRYEYGSSEDSVQVSLRRGSGTSTAGGSIGTAPRSLIFNSLNPAEINILVLSDIEGGSYELVTLPKSTSGGAVASEVPDSKRGQALGVAFVARNRFAVLDRSRQILIKNLRNEVGKKFPSPYPTTDGMFPAGTAGRVLLRSEDRISLFDTNSRRILGEVVVAMVRHVVWNKDGTMVALLCKHAVVICNKQLEQLCTVPETVRVKSGAWGPHGIFVYTTLNHIKYCIPNGDAGVIRTLDLPIYITRVTKDTLYCLDRECKVRKLSIDTTECLFKIALMRKQYGEVIRMIRHANLCGQAIIAYLQAKGYPEVALHFVEDKKTRFNLAIECGNLEVAMTAALEVDDTECWTRLGVEALRQGNQKIVEMAYQRTKDFERLSFLYLITGNTDKLRKMLKIAEMRGDVMSRFHNALYLGDAAERVKILEEVGQLSLAYVAAVSHGLNEDAERIAGALSEAGVELPQVDPSSATLLMPPNPIFRDAEENWPLLEVSKSIISQALQDGVIPDGADLSAYNETPEADVANEVTDDGFADDFNDDAGDALGGGGVSAFPGDDDLDLGADGGGFPGDDESDIEFDDEDVGGPAAEADFEPGISDGGAGGVFVAPTPGADRAAAWVQNSSLAADHVAAGSFGKAMQLLNRQIGLVNFAPLEESMMDVFLGARCVVPGLPCTRSVPTLMQRNDKDGNPGAQSLPEVCVKLSLLVEKLRVAYQYFQQGKFQEALTSFREILLGIPLLVVPSREVPEVKELLGICREYITGILIELERRDTEDAVRQAELAAYFTRCTLQPAHMILVLNLAMTRAFKLKNYITAASFAQRLLNMSEINAPTQSQLKTKASKVLRASEQHGRNEVKLNYDENAQFSICSQTNTPIADATSALKCPFCAATCTAEGSGKLCKVCTLSPMGRRGWTRSASAAAPGGAGGADGDVAAASQDKSKLTGLARTLDQNPEMANELVEVMSHNTKLRIANAILDQEVSGGRSYSDYLARRHRQNIMIREISFSMGDDIKDQIDVDKDGHVSSQELNEWLQNLMKMQNTSGGRAPLEPTPTQLWQFALLSGVPFVAFGFLDNAIMLVAGDVIDTQLGRVLGISTLAAAGLGNMISDVAGLGLGGYVEASSKRLGLKDPKLTLQQMQTRKIRFLNFIATSIGICIGCILGMVPLLFMDAEENNMKEMFEMMKADSSDGKVSVNQLMERLEEGANLMGSENYELVAGEVKQRFTDEAAHVSYRQFREFVKDLRKLPELSHFPENQHFTNLFCEAVGIDY
ncbi:Coatomer subunit alpha-1 [Hondaea fermentalgiana]|uniref:Coatomer subunit alpha-1 n=1 Tax=Hondaea fermentalgiana TaxID=2315210 RepID=A0A2R5GVU4_9STRA|nr:Coatomer subunit alpha-1 [Hondaea fermentalgiana]|eukprot:GBG32531.1 Coatomer subunit alpha-1 [Hondaea fermentalgiana]